MLQRALERLAVAMALIGGVVLSGIALLTAISIVGRWLIDRPIFGDVEMVQIGCAMAIALFLPYCQARHGHVIVDFFTLKAQPRTRERLDAIGSVVVSAILLVLGWRAAVGVFEMRQYGETSMVLGFPTWLTYLAMVPGLLVAGLIGLANALRSWRSSLR